MEVSAGSRRVLSATVSCRLGRAIAEREQPEDRGICRLRHCAADLDRPAFAVPVADLGDRGQVRSVVCGDPCSRGACRRSCSSRGRPSAGRVLPKAAKRTQVMDRGTPATSPIMGGGGVLTSGASLGVPSVCRAAGLQAFEQIVIKGDGGQPSGQPTPSARQALTSTPVHWISR
jgi:hypothetical protein